MINKSLFDLVKSLTKAEKRYISFYKLNGSGKGGKMYLQFFDAICKYDDRAEVSGFLATLPISKKKLNNTQNYLYQLILSGLRSFNSESSVRILLRNMLIEAEILFKKSLIKQSLRKLDHAQVIAEKYLLTEILLDIGIQKQIVLSQLDLLYYTTPGFKDQEINRSMELQKRAVSNLSTEVACRELSISYFSDYSKFVTKQKAADHLRQLMGNPLVSAKESDLSMEAWSSIMGLKNLAYFFAGKYKEGVKYAYGHLNGMERKYLHIANESPDQWAALVYNYLGYCFYLKQYDKVIVCLEKIKHILNFSKRKGSKLSEARLWFNYYLYQLVINTKIVNFENVDKVVKRVADFFSNYKKYIRDEYFVTLNYLIAYNYFINGSYKESLFWLNKNINDTNDNVRPDYQVQTRILYFIVQVDRRNNDLYKTAYDQFVECVEESAIAEKFESTIRRLMEDILAQADQETESDKCFLKFKAQLVKMKRDETEERKLEHYFDYISWAESKIKNQPFAQILEENASRVKAQ